MSVIKAENLLIMTDCAWFYTMYTRIMSVIKAENLLIMTDCAWFYTIWLIDWFVYYTDIVNDWIFHSIYHVYKLYPAHEAYKSVSQ